MYVGLDVHKKSSHAVIQDSEGRKLHEVNMQNSVKQWDKFLGSLSGNTKFIMEACSVWEPMYDYIESKGFDVVLAHPLKTRAIAEAKVKTDSVDANILAHLLRTSLVAESYVPKKEIRKLRTIARHRTALVRTRTQNKNRIHAILAKEGITHELSDLFGRYGMKVLREIPLKLENRFAMNNFLELLEKLNVCIAETESYIETRARGIREIELLTTIPGISTYSATLIYSEIGDIRRFSNPKKLCKYAGLTSSVYQSGSKMRFGKITKEGSAWLRWILIQNIHHTVRKDNAVARYHKKILKRKGKHVAKIASARKLLIYIYIMLTQKITFQELRVNA